MKVGRCLTDVVGQYSSVWGSPESKVFSVIVTHFLLIFDMLIVLNEIGDFKENITVAISDLKGYVLWII